jgi:homoserine dehydrogenase
MSKLGPEKAIHVAVVGLGGVGKALMEQLIETPYPINIAAISNSRKMLLFTDGTTCFNHLQWATALDAADAPDTNLDVLRDALGALAKRSTTKVVLVDNTSSEAVANAYPKFLDAGIHVVTPNKKAFSGDLGLYKRLIGESGSPTELPRGVFYNESTVGAGLPIISTLKDLVNTGDKVYSLSRVAGRGPDEVYSLDR